MHPEGKTILEHRRPAIPHHITPCLQSDIQPCWSKSILHNVLMVSPTEIHQSVVMVITNYAGSISDSSPLPLTDNHWHWETYFEKDKTERGGWEDWIERMAGRQMRRRQGTVSESKSRVEKKQREDDKEVNVDWKWGESRRGGAIYMAVLKEYVGEWAYLLSFQVRWEDICLWAVCVTQ